jgi:hypothetical protein
MSVTETYFRSRIDECSALARRATRKDDRVFWEEAARRWQALLDRYSGAAGGREEAQARKPGTHSKEAA